MSAEDERSVDTASLPQRVSSSMEWYSPELKLLVGFIPVAGPALSTYIEDLSKRRAKRLESTLNAFAEQSGASPTDLFEAATKKDSLRDLVAETLDTAQRSADDRKLLSRY